MRKRIDGRRFDTETAEKLADWASATSDGTRVTHALMMKRTGEMFLHTTVDQRGSGLASAGRREWVEPCSLDAAADMVCEHAENSMAVLSRMAERVSRGSGDGATVMLQVRVSREARERLRRAARAEGVTMSRYVEEMIGRIPEG